MKNLALLGFQRMRGLEGVVFAPPTPLVTGGEQAGTPAAAGQAGAAAGD